MLAEQQQSPFWEGVEAAIINQQQTKRSARNEGMRKQKTSTQARSEAARNRRDQLPLFDTGLLAPLD